MGIGIQKNGKKQSLGGRGRALNGSSNIFIGPKRAALTTAAVFFWKENNYDREPKSEDYQITGGWERLQGNCQQAGHVSEYGKVVLQTEQYQHGNSGRINGNTCHQYNPL